MSRFSYFIANPVTGDDGYHLKAADAVQIEKFMKGVKKALDGGSFFVRSMPIIPQKKLMQMLYDSYGGKMPFDHASRICQSDILRHFGLKINIDNTIAKV